MNSRNLGYLSADDLKSLLTVCDARSISRAASRLGVSQPSLSRSIRNLEEDIGLALFRRTGRGVEPTEAGLILREHAGRVLEELYGAQQRLDAIRDVNHGEVTVLLPHYVSKVLVPPIVKRFSSLFPRAAIHIFEEAAAEIPQRLTEGDADLGLFYPPQSRLSLEAEPVATERMYLVCLPGTVGRDHVSITFNEAAKLPLILSSRYTPYRHYLEQFATAADKQFRVIRELEVSHTQLAFVLEGEGATILPLSHCYQEIASGHVVGLAIERPVMYRQILMAFGRRSPSRLAISAARLFKDIIASCGATCGWECVAMPPSI